MNLGPLEFDTIPKEDADDPGSWPGLFAPQISAELSTLPAPTQNQVKNLLLRKGHPMIPNSKIPEAMEKILINSKCSKILSELQA